MLGKPVAVKIDRPMGSLHPKHGFVYEINYGYIEGVQAPDGEDLDVYFLGVDQAVEVGKGVVKAIIHRLEDDDDKLVVMPEEINFSDEQIEKLVNFQEQWFEHEIIRN